MMMNPPASSNSTIQWRGKWIGSTVGPVDGLNRVCEAGLESHGAPWLRQVFDCENPTNGVFLYVAAPGWFCAFVNGKEVGDAVLSPVITQFTARVSYVRHDITSLVQNGRNAIAVLLGNGWYNCQSRMSGQFEHSPWRNQPAMLLQIEDGAGNVLLQSDQTWKASPSHIVMDALRAGETQDTRLEVNGISCPDFDDAALPRVDIMNPPPGIIVPEDCEPCRVAQRTEPKTKWTLADGSTVYDFADSITGWCELEAGGPAGSTVILQHGERLFDDGTLDTREDAAFVGPELFQKDTYILNGTGVQKLHPHFCYHGFRYVKITCDGGAIVRRLTADFIHTDFASLGEFTAPESPTLTRLQELTRRAYLCNFTGIPTDCPHREKNGWTGDHNFAYETGCFNFDIHHGMAHFTQIFIDTQRPSGQLPGIAPTGIWGYNWGNGPGWDAFLFEAAEKSLLFKNDDTIIRTHYDAMVRYIDYCHHWHDIDGIVDFGLGDWAAHVPETMPEVALTSTGFYYDNVRRLAQFATYLGRTRDADAYRQLADRIKNAFCKRFMRPDGSCGNNSLTALATPLFFGLLSDDAARKTYSLFLKKVEQEHYHANFGVYGAKFVPRVLGREGSIDAMVRMLTQDECPGWGFWVKQGATSLWEHWDGHDSLMHVMFGDISACMFRYLAGIAPVTPGFATFSLTPATLCTAVPVFHCHHDSPHGRIVSEIIRTDTNARLYKCTVPPNTEAILHLNDETSVLAPGDYAFELLA